MTRRKLACWIATCCLFGPAATRAVDHDNALSGPEQTLETAVRHAQTWFQLGLAEHGNLAAFAAGQRYLPPARDAWKLVARNEKTRPLGRELEGLEHDFDGQMALARGTLNGRFPLYRVLASSWLKDSHATATFQLTGDPAVKGSTDAAAAFAAQLDTLDKKLVSLPLIVVADTGGAKHNRLLEDQVLRVLRPVARLSPTTHAASDRAFTPEQLAAARAGQPIAPTADLQNAFGPRILLMRIQQEDQCAKAQRYSLSVRTMDLSSATLRKADAPDSDHADSTPAVQHGQVPLYATSVVFRDRRDRLPWALLSYAVLLGVAYAAYATIVGLHRRGGIGGTWAGAWALPGLGFAIGCLLPHALSPLPASLGWPADAPLAISFWQPCVVGLVALGLPLLAYWLLAPWLMQLWPSLSPALHGGAMYVAIGAGIAAYLAGPLALCLDDHVPASVLCAAGAALALAYGTGRALDTSDPLPIWTACLPLGLTLPVGAALCAGRVGWLAAAAGTCLVAAAAAATWDVRRRRSGAKTGDAPLSAAGIPATIDELLERVECPVYQPFAAYRLAYERLRSVLDGRVCHLGLHGPRGAGKSAIARAMLDALRTACAAKGLRCTVLHGACPQPMGTPAAYAPFAQALARHFEVNLLAPPGPKIQQIGETLGGIFGSLVPFGRILFPSSGADGAVSASPEEIHASIAWLLERLTHDGPVLLVLDDVQWLDDASAALLKHLLATFRAEQPQRLAIVALADQCDCLQTLPLDVEREVVPVPYLSPQEQVQVLVGGVGLQPAVAEEIIGRTGVAQETHGGLLWPLEIVARLARSGALVRSDAGFTWSAGRWPADFAIPDHMRAAIRQQWDAAAPYRSVLECAACSAQGREFLASVVARALGKPYLDVLLTLDEIERRTGLIHDVRERDDVYAFHSTFLLQVIREELQIAGHGPGQRDVPQIIREYHARLAAALEGLLKTAPARLHEVANHYYAAGPHYAPQALDHCLRTAQAFATACDFARALEYLRMARECAEFVPGSPPVEPREHAVTCRQAVVTLQENERLQAAQREREYLDAHPDAPACLVLAVAELAYEVGHRMHDADWLAQAAELCSRVLANGPTTREQAQALHLQALCVPAADHDRRVAGLRAAYQLLESVADDDREGSLCGAQILVSLAKELSKGAPAERAQARDLFQRRLDLEAQRRLGDLRGVAMAQAGLGRLELYRDPPDYAAARTRLQRNLEVCQAIGDKVNQVKMHSLLGACAWKLGECQQALACYEAARDCCRDPIDRCYVAAGLLRCYAQAGRREPIAAEVAWLAQRMAERRTAAKGFEPIPADCRQQICEALQSCPQDFQDEGLRELLGMLRG